MKRDRRLRRLGERRTIAHGGAYGRRPRYRPTSTRTDAVVRIARALRLPARVLMGSPSAFDASARMEAAYRDSLLLYGEAFVKVEWRADEGAIDVLPPGTVIVPEFSDLWP